ncbi:hypothetical protein [Herbaspirillum lusitanum]|uniref:hypothetical protein n=1 Tax=Herbaspirillum lusitanum TaxID=213312 RepID=UPI001EE63F86|nr:hypothetical protein [Herbaspirillum lusitanum]
MLRLQYRAHLQVELNELFPGVTLRVMQGVLQINPADVWPVVVNGAGFARRIVVPAHAIAAVEETGLFGEIDVLAA